MRLNDFFKQGREDYLSIRPPERISLYGWPELRDRLEGKFRLRDIFAWFVLRPAVSAALVVIFFLSMTVAVVASSQVSAPGETLYPVKRFYENIASSITGSDEVKVEGRAQDIIILSQKEKEDSEKLKEAVIQYSMTVGHVEAETDSTKRQELKERLDRHETEFQKIYEEDKSEEIKKAIEATHINEEDSDHD